jgi:hypothetical protein
MGVVVFLPYESYAVCVIEHKCFEVALRCKERNAGYLYSFVPRLEWFEHTNQKLPGILLMRLKDKTNF